MIKKLLIQHLIHDDNHYYKLSINPHKVGVVLLERKDLKKNGFTYYFDCKIILIMKRMLRNELYIQMA